MRTDASISGDEREFLQQRIAHTGLVAMLAYSATLVIRSIAFYDEYVGQPPFYWDLLGPLGFAILWLSCRATPRSTRFIRTAEAVGLMVSSAAVGMMGTQLALVVRPDYIVVLILTYFLLARSIFVPSSARRTFALGLGMGVIILCSVYYSFQRSPDADGITPVMLNAATFWLGAVGLAAAASRVIYGLRKQIRDVRQLGQYRLDELLGAGGMGVVYRAHHAMLRRPTAVKLLHAERADPGQAELFEREVQLTASLSHPNIITIFDYGRTSDGTFYYAMELIDGATLAQVVNAAGPLPASRVVHLMYQASGALVEAHGVGLIHRDIKPANLMVYLPHAHGGINEVVKVLDFGLVKQIEPDSNLAASNPNARAGTPLYMSPEAVLGTDPIDHRSDLYALGAVGYFLLTGTHVFHASSAIEVLAGHLNEPAEPPSERLGAAVPADLEQLLLDCLHKHPAERPQSALAVQERLAACRDFSTWSDEQARSWWQANRDRTQARPRAISAEQVAISLSRTRAG